MADCTAEQFQSTFLIHNNDAKTNEEEIAEIANRCFVLHQAVKHKNRDMINYLIKMNVNVNQEDDQECSPLYYALVDRDKCIIHSLMKA